MCLGDGRPARKAKIELVKGGGDMGSFKVELFSDAAEAVEVTHQATIYEARIYVKKQLMRHHLSAYAATITSQNPSSFLCAYRTGDDVLFLADAIAYSRSQAARLRVTRPGDGAALGPYAGGERRHRERRKG